MLRTGASALLLLAVLAVAFAAQRDGWDGAARVFFAFLHPVVVFGLIPLALVVGGILTAVRRAFLS